MYEKGLGINSNAAEQIQNHFQGKLTFEISSLLENLTDSNLVPKTELGVKPGFYTFATAVSFRMCELRLIFYFFTVVFFKHLIFHFLG